MKTNTSTAPLLTAYNLLGKMTQAARTAGDIGREFLTSGVHRLLAREITNRRAAAKQAKEIKAEVHTAAAMFEEFAADGQFTAAEQSRFRAALRKPERHATTLASALAIEEGAR